jgi:predicted O-methyltransferase YrrM
MKNPRINFLRQLKTYGIKKNIPNVSETTAAFLHFMIKSLKAKSALEIGCANGYSTIWLADALESTGGNLITCDVSKPSFDQAQENIKSCGLEKIVTFQFGDALELLPNLKQKFDFVFIDAQKSLYHLYWEQVKALLTNSAVVVVDDVLKFPQKTKLFTELIQKESNYEHIVLPVDGDDGIMLIRSKR